MPSLPGMDGEVFFGDPEQPLPDWREALPEGEEESDELSPEERAAVVAMIGFDPAPEPVKEEAVPPQVRPSPFKKSLSYPVKGEGTCKQGERSDLTGCTPASQESSGGNSVDQDEEGRWDGFGSEEAQQLREYQNKLNRKPYVPLTEEEVSRLQQAGFLTRTKHPKITKEGREEIWRGEQTEAEDIQKEVDEVEDATYRRIEIFKAISDYQQLSHDQVNSYLRGSGHFTGIALQDGKDTAEKILQAFEEPRIYKVTKKAQVVYRGIENYGVYKKLVRAKIGTIIKDKALLSTSSEYDIASAAAGGFSNLTPSVFLTVVVPKGTKYLSGRRDEKELIFAPSTKLKIVDRMVQKKSEVGEAQLFLRVELVR